ncbi:MAG: hypothetical protein IJN21_10645 [Clostridia bacterium]|nr:hypothetical protein [Clostridiales bacterium]MBQ6716965.1 hypothetical protein [Clostridia bacterium]
MRQNTVRKRNYWFEALGLIEVMAFILLGYAIFRDWMSGIYVGSLTYLVVAWTLRLTLQKHHRKGMRLLKAEMYEKALVCFQKSEAFFEKHAWIDKYRFITMFSSSAYSYREMALHNQAHAYLRLNCPLDAIAPLEKLAKINPKRTDAAKAANEIREKLKQEDKDNTNS